jgi:hypothetical protein
MRQLPISEAWNETVAFVGRESGLLFPVAFALIALPNIIFQYAMPPMVPDQPIQPQLWMLLAIPFFVLTLLGTLTLSIMALRGGTSVGEALAIAARRLLPVLAAAILLGVVGGALTSVLLIPIRLVTGGNLPLAIALALPLVIAIFVWLGVRMIFVNPVGAIEQGGPIEILRRSWALTRGHFGRLFAFLFVLLLVAGIVSIAVSAIFGIVITLTIGRPDQNDLALLLLLLLSGLVNTVISVYLTVVVAKLYAKATAD